MLFVTTIFVFWATVSDAHTAAWSKGMYCLNGTTPGTDNPNNDVPVRPLYQLSKTDWWFQHDRGCDQFPPATEDYLELPAGGQATLELAHNRAQTTLSFDGASAGDWPDGRSHPEDWNGRLELDGNNVQVPPGASPGYSMVNGFSAGAQNDIFDQGAMALQSTLNMTLSLNSTQSALSPPSSTSSEVPAVREQVVRRRI
ncbi:hypothetical protein MMC06_001924 [Schaereria dolodes]|nr:hypothetical protein [Schaereria dolodes]